MRREEVSGLKREKQEVTERLAIAAQKIGELEETVKSAQQMTTAAKNSQEKAEQKASLREQRVNELTEERRRLQHEVRSLKEAQQKLQQDLLSAIKEKADATARLEERSKTTTTSPAEDSETKAPRVKASGRTQSAHLTPSDTTETGT